MDVLTRGYQPPHGLRALVRDALADRLAAIIRTQNELMAAPDDVSEILALVARRTQELTDADGASVELVQGDSLIVWAASGAIQSRQGAIIPRTSTLSGLCLEERTFLRCDDTETDPRVNREICRAFGVRSMIAVPLMSREGPVGVLRVVSVRPRAFTDSLASSLQLMSGLISASISRAAAREASDALVQHQEETARALKAAAADLSATAEALAIAAAEKEEAAAALAERNLVLSTFFEASPQMIGMVERVGMDDFRFLQVNEASCRTYGFTAAQMRRKLASELGISAESRRACLPAFDSAAQTGRTARWEYSRPSAEGLRRYVGNLTRVPNGCDAQLFCYVIEDVTEQMTLRERLEVQERMAAVGRLAAGVAHEVNNPLAYVIGNLTFVKDQLRSLQPKASDPAWTDVQEALDEAREGAERVKLVVKDLYSFVRGDGDKDVRELNDLLQIADRAAHLASSAVLPRARLVREFEDPAPVRANGARLGQVIINLLANAAQAMPHGRATEQNRIVLRVGSSGDTSYVEVEDNGDGIPPDVLGRIFEPFFTTKPAGQGMGLGLSICSSIASDHGGELTVESAAGKGTCFRLTLPRAPLE